MLNERVRWAIVSGVCLTLVLFAAGRADAQSAIAGTVKDASGAVMPGVTVEASSPVLIEKTRSVTTDGSGQYRIIDLRPGVYTVTFTLAGFSTVIREGVDLPATFTANIDAELRVGSLEESITVSGQTPLVDVQTATQQQVLSRELLEAVPTGRNIWGVGSTLTGVSLSAPDVGGTAGMQQTYMAVHGSDRRDNSIQVDGMIVNGIEGDGAIQNYFNQGMFEEMSYQTSALGAEVQSSGVRLNMIPRDGSNVFKGSVFWSHTPGSWQSDNFTPELAATGLRAPNRVERIFDFNPGLGGPIMKDRIWFYGTFRRWGVDQTVTDSFYNLDPTHRTYQPDVNNPTVDDNVIKSGAARITFVIAGKHKFGAYLDRIVKFRGHECTAQTFPTEEACGIRSPKRYFTAQAKYTGTLTSQLLAEVGWSENDETYSTNEHQPSVQDSDVGRLDRATTARWSSVIGPYYFRVPDRHTIMGQMSYVTGTHNLKGGLTWGFGGNRHQRSIYGGLDLYQEYNTVNGVQSPASVIVYSTPQEARERIKYDMGIYLQDTYTLKRLSVSPGIRFELFNTFVPAQAAPPGRFVPFRQFDKIENLPNWKDVAPRLGAVYDLMGDGRTAIKGHVGKYMQAFSTVGFAAIYNPMVIATDRRTWADSNRDDIAQDNEIGPVQIPFNVSGASIRTPDPDIKRPYQWETSLGIQREIITGISVSAGWVHRNFKRIFWTDNILVDDSDYTVVNIPNPCAAPGANCGGETAEASIPIYNLNPAKRGLVQQVDKNSTNKRTYNGVDFGFSARIGGGNIYGGTSIGKQVVSWCEVDDPNSRRFCDLNDLDIPYMTQFKIAGSYPLPYDIQLSGSWQGYPGTVGGTVRQDAVYETAFNRIQDTSLNVNYNVTPAVVRAANPNVALTQASITVPLLVPGTKYLERWDQVDVRLAKKFQVKKVRMQGQFDIFNILNGSDVLSRIEAYGSSLDRPATILQGRLFAVGMQLNF